MWNSNFFFSYEIANTAAISTEIYLLILNNNTKYDKDVWNNKTMH